MGQPVADHEDRDVGPRRLSGDGESGVRQTVRVRQELPERALPRIVRVYDRVEVESKIHLDNVARAEHDSRHRLGRAREPRREHEGSRVECGPGATVSRIGDRRVGASDVIGHGDRHARAGVCSEGLNREVRPADVARPRGGDRAVHDTNVVGAGGEAGERVPAGSAGRNRSAIGATCIVELDTRVGPRDAIRGSRIASRAAAVIDVFEDGAVDGGRLGGAWRKACGEEQGNQQRERSHQGFAPHAISALRRVWRAPRWRLPGMRSRRASATHGRSVPAGSPDPLARWRARS